MKVYIFPPDNEARIEHLDNGINESLCFVIDKRKTKDVFSNHLFLQSDHKVFVAKESFPYSMIDNWVSSDENVKKFDAVFTTQMSLMSKQKSKDIFYIPFGDPWCSPVKQDISSLKSFTVTYMPGKKNIGVFEGHRVRKQVYSLLSESNSSLDVSIKLYDPNVWVDEKSSIFDDYQFSIIIENCVADGWFTEKLLDPMLRMTVPIYRGDPFLGNIFDSRGYICFDTPAELLQILQSLDSSTYNSMLPYALENYKTAIHFYEKKFYQRMIDLAVDVFFNK